MTTKQAQEREAFGVLASAAQFFHSNNMPEDHRRLEEAISTLQADLQWQAEQQAVVDQPCASTSVEAQKSSNVSHNEMPEGWKLAPLLLHASVINRIWTECRRHGLDHVAFAWKIQQQADGDLTRRLQQQCSDWGSYWRAPDAHGVQLSHEQATELLRNALGVEVEIAASPPAPAQGGQWISVHDSLPELPVDNEDEGVGVWTWDGTFVTADAFAPQWEQPAGPAIGGWVRTDDWFCNDTAGTVTHWMLRVPPAAPQQHGEQR